MIVLLDEPFSNLDATMRQEMRREVQGILRESGTAAVFVTHDREEAFATADRVGVMRDGRLEQLDAPDVVYHAPATPFVAEMAGVTGFIPGEVQGGLAVTEIGKSSLQERQRLPARRVPGEAAGPPRRPPGGPP